LELSGRRPHISARLNIFEITSRQRMPGREDVSEVVVEPRDSARVTSVTLL
jgi:hypothetical protein